MVQGFHSQLEMSTWNCYNYFGFCFQSPKTKKIKMFKFKISYWLISLSVMVKHFQLNKLNKNTYRLISQIIILLLHDLSFRPWAHFLLPYWFQKFKCRIAHIDIAPWWRLAAMGACATCGTTLHFSKLMF